eukprot:2186507-Pleurochrysis_carterae.AAC.1
MNVPLARGRPLILFSVVDLVVHDMEVDIPLTSVVLLYRFDSAAPPSNRRGGVRPTRMMRVEVLRGASPQIAASGRGDYGRTELSTPETASYSHMTARTVRVSGTEPFQSAAMQGYREYLENTWKNILDSRAKQNAKREN